MHIMQRSVVHFKASTNIRLQLLLATRSEAYYALAPTQHLPANCTAAKLQLCLLHRIADALDNTH
jgi:hypothetical protein